MAKAINDGIDCYFYRYAEGDCLKTSPLLYSCLLNVCEALLYHYPFGQRGILLQAAVGTGASLLLFSVLSFDFLQSLRFPSISSLIDDSTLTSQAYQRLWEGLEKAKGHVAYTGMGYLSIPGYHGRLGFINILNYLDDLIRKNYQVTEKESPPLYQIKMSPQERELGAKILQKLDALRSEILADHKIPCDWNPCDCCSCKECGFDWNKERSELFFCYLDNAANDQVSHGQYLPEEGYYRLSSPLDSEQVRSF
jgi:hypothetical protein